MRTMTLLLALLLGGNGLAMLTVAADWYQWVPGVADTGPFNLHFIRDIGCIYLLSGLAYGWLAYQPGAAWPAALTACGFLLLHALTHVSEVLVGTRDLHHLVQDLPGVFLVPLWAGWLLYRPLQQRAATPRLAFKILED